MIDQAAGRVPVVAHCGATATAPSLELARHAEASGAAAVLAVHPFYAPRSDAELVGYYADLAGASALPVASTTSRASRAPVQR